MTISTNGLLPDFEIEENYGAELEILVPAEDQLLCNRFYIEWKNEVPGGYQSDECRRCYDFKPQPDFQACTIAG